MIHRSNQGIKCADETLWSTRDLHCCDVCIRIYEKPGTGVSFYIVINIAASAKIEPFDIPQKCICGSHGWCDTRALMLRCTQLQKSIDNGMRSVLCRTPTHEFNICHQKLYRQHFGREAHMWWSCPSGNQTWLVGHCFAWHVRVQISPKFHLNPESIVWV